MGFWAPPPLPGKIRVNIILNAKNNNITPFVSKMALTGQKKIKLTVEIQYSNVDGTYWLMFGLAFKSHSLLIGPV